MYTKTKYSVLDMALWTRFETALFLFIALVPTCLYEILGWKWMQLPWAPIMLIGTAVAFLIGFQNNAAYERAWEARKIWGGIVNVSRTWTVMINDMVTNELASRPHSIDQMKSLKAPLVHRHIAWLTALRHAMRQPRDWEVFKRHVTNQEWYNISQIPERDSRKEDDLRVLLSDDELTEVLSKTNRSTAIINIQSRHLRSLKEEGYIWGFSFLAFENVLREMLDLQGQSERIKNFPYPRQYATLSFDFVAIFVVIMPLGIIPEFARIGETVSASNPFIGSIFIWLAVPFSAMVSGIFHTMQRIGTVGENPFEGSKNDVPISTIARSIEIDIREMIDEDPSTIPDPLPIVHGIQM